ETTSGTITVIHPAGKLTTKSVSPDTIVEAGSSVSITVTETNTGDTTLFSPSVTGTGCTKWTDGASFLSPGASTDFVCSLTVDSPVNGTATAHAFTTLETSAPLTNQTTGGTIDIFVPPTIASISPASRIAGGPSFTLTVNGDNFQSTATVWWNS